MPERLFVLVRETGAVLAELDISCDRRTEVAVPLVLTAMDAAAAIFLFSGVGSRKIG